jgi:hypothetical protein
MSCSIDNPKFGENFHFSSAIQLIAALPALNPLPEMTCDRAAALKYRVLQVDTALALQGRFSLP